MPTNTNTSCDCLIVGAGPVGLTMALELTRFGLKCRIVDENAAATDKSKALVMWPRTLELLDRSASADEFVAAGIWAKGASIYGSDMHGKAQRLVQIGIHRRDTRLPGTADDSAERNGTGAWRAASAPGNRGPAASAVNRLRLFSPRESRGANGVPSSVIATLRLADGSEEKVTCAWLLGCDGGIAWFARRWELNSPASLSPTIGSWPTCILMARPRRRGQSHPPRRIGDSPGRSDSQR